MPIQAELYYWKDSNMGMGHVAIRVFNPEIPDHDGQYISWAQGNNYARDRNNRNPAFPLKILLPAQDNRNYNEFLQEFEQSIYYFPREDRGKQYNLIRQNCAHCVVDIAKLAGYQNIELPDSKLLRPLPSQVARCFAGYKDAIIIDEKFYDKRLEEINRQLTQSESVEENCCIDAVIDMRNIIIEKIGILFRHSIEKPKVVAPALYFLSNLTKQRLLDDSAALAGNMFNQALILHDEFKEDHEEIVLNCLSLLDKVQNLDKIQENNRQHYPSNNKQQLEINQSVIRNAAPINKYLLSLLAGRKIADEKNFDINIFELYLRHDSDFDHFYEDFKKINIDDEGVGFLYRKLREIGHDILPEEEKDVRARIQQQIEGKDFRLNNYDIYYLKSEFQNNPQHIKILMEYMEIQYLGLQSIGENNEELFCGLNLWLNDINSLYSGNDENYKDKAEYLQGKLIDFIQEIAPLYHQETKRKMPEQEISRRITHAFGSLQETKIAMSNRSTSWYNMVVKALKAIASTIFIVPLAYAKYKTGSTKAWTPYFQCRSHLHDVKKALKTDLNQEDSNLSIAMRS